MRIETDNALTMTQWLYDNRCGGTLTLCLFDSEGRYSVTQFSQVVADPEREISVGEARARAETHAQTGGEVRITNDLDLIVYHVRAGCLIFPPNQDRVEFFWERAGWSEHDDSE
jgi:hypothetical protein